MAHAVEVRPPFLDHRIVEFSSTLPADFKIRGARQKYLLKELMKPKLPAAIVQRKKIGFDIPAHEWLRGTLRSMLVETLTSAEEEHSELFRFDVHAAAPEQADKHRLSSVGPCHSVSVDETMEYQVSTLPDAGKTDAETGARSRTLGSRQFL